MTTSAPRSRFAPSWIPAWPMLGAFFAGALILSLITHDAASGVTAAAEADWSAFASTMAMGVVGTVLAGIVFGLAATAAVCAEFGLRRRSYGAKSLSIFLLAIIATYAVGVIASDISLEAYSVYGLRDPMDLRIMPVLLFALVAWPVGHLVGLGYGVAAQCRRGERPWLGLVGICCNLLALPVWYITVFESSRPAATF